MPRESHRSRLPAASEGNVRMGGRHNHVVDNDHAGPHFFGESLRRRQATKDGGSESVIGVPPLSSGLRFR